MEITIKTNWKICFYTFSSYKKHSSKTSSDESATKQRVSSHHQSPAPCLSKSNSQCTQRSGRTRTLI